MPVPESSSGSASKTPDAEAGLAAFKQGDYPTAIALLESVSLPADHPLSDKVQMGLVIAHARSGEPSRAVALCHWLGQSDKPQLKEWAQQTLVSLEKRYPEVVAQYQPDAGANGLNGLSQPLARGADPADDISGFVPIDPAASDSASEPDVSGFVPIDPASPVPSPETESPVTHSVASEGSEPSTGTGQPKPNVINRLRSARARGQQAATETATDAEPLESPSLYQPAWRNAGRAQRWQALGDKQAFRLLLLQVGTAIALFWVIQQVPYQIVFNIRVSLTYLTFLGYRSNLFGPPIWSVLIGLVILFVASRWMLDALLKLRYGLQPFSLEQLASYSPETAQALQRYCRQRRIPIPALGLLPATAPIAFSYGCIPRVTRTVVSQGLLEQLADDEIATVYASEIGHIGYWDVPLMSLVAVVIQIPYTLYALIAEWGNRQSFALTRGVAALLAALSYGAYALPRWVALWLSRHRVYYSDRSAVNLTGNPNGLTRALLKLAIGTAKAVQSQGKTDYLLEGFDILSPLGHRMATTLGSLHPHTPLEPVLEWETSNPLRHWLAINNSHPPTGDRLQRLASYARQWKLDTELDLAAQRTTGSQKGRLTAQQWRRLLLQGLPFVGLALGFVVAYLLSGVGWVAGRMQVDYLAWMFGDRSLLRGLPLIGFSVGTLLRINRFFPDTTVVNDRTAAPPSLVGLLKPSTSLPIDSQPVRLQGTLLGRPGISNLLSQDLLLHTSTGIVRLHCLSRWGPIGNLLPQRVSPTELINQDLSVVGWFRRGATPWIDVETLRTSGGRTSHSYHPVWSTILAMLSALLGAYLIARGGLL